MSGTTCDSSVLIAAMLPTHPQHHSARNATSAGLAALPGHVMFECFSVLTRLPAPRRISADDAAGAIGALGLPVLTLPGERHGPLIVQLAASGLRGGAVYDGVIAATALHHGLRLLTADRCATSTYDTVGVAYTLI